MCSIPGAMIQLSPHHIFSKKLTNEMNHFLPVLRWFKASLDEFITSCPVWGWERGMKRWRRLWTGGQNCQSGSGDAVSNWRQVYLLYTFSSTAFSQKSFLTTDFSAQVLILNKGIAHKTEHHRQHLVPKHYYLL